MRILSVFAHREDHVVCGWPILQNADFERFLICCTDDGIVPLEESCRIEGIAFEGVLGFPNGFFRNTSHGPHSLNVIAKTLIARVEEVRLRVNPDYIFLHNPYGEYGHFDHRLVFEILYDAFLKSRFLISNIQAHSSHTIAYNQVPRVFNHFYKKVYDVVKPNLDFYRRNKKLYTAFKMWTDNPYLNEPKYPYTASLYEC